MKKFIVKNYVFLVGLCSCISLFLEQANTSMPHDFKVLGTGLLMAVIGYMANSWKGGGITVTGILASLATVFIQVHSTGTIDWTTFALLSLTKIMAALTASLEAYKPKE